MTEPWWKSYVVEDYEPAFPRNSRTRRVLSFITDENDSFAGNQPRNTLNAILIALRAHEPVQSEENEIYPISWSSEIVERELGTLCQANFVERLADDTYRVTAFGWCELMN